MALFPNSRYAVAAWALALAFALTAPATARAQGHTADPFNGVGDYNNVYEQYLYPSYPTGYGFSPGQGRLAGNSGLRGSNRFQEYVEDLDGFGTDLEGGSLGGGRGGGLGSPYYRAYRQYDREYKRTYIPNERVDREYDRDREERDDLYFQYLHETDPKKKAKLFKEYTELSRKVTRDLSAASRSSTATARTNPARRAITVDPYDRYRRRPSAAPAPPGTARSLTTPRSLTAPPPPGRETDARRRSATPAPPGVERPTDVLRRSMENDSPTRARRAPAAVRPSPSVPSGPSPLERETTDGNPKR